MLPVNQYDPNTFKYVTYSNGDVIPQYSFQDPNSADFQYTFNSSINNTLGITINNHSSGLGYWGSNFIGSPRFICHPLNVGNAFSDDFPNWLSTINAQIDLRAFYVECQGNNINNYSFKRLIPDQPEVIGTLSSYTGTPVAYTT